MEQETCPGITHRLSSNAIGARAPTFIAECHWADVAGAVDVEVRLIR